MLGLEYSGQLDPEGTLGKAETLVGLENHNVVRDSGVVCAFGGDYLTDERLEVLFDADYEELQDVGARTVERERHFNNKRGKDVGDDDLPYDIPDLEEAVQEYYEARGWNDDGTVPDASVDSVAPASADD
ncbi:MAG: aldehyde ferredoxin oxidoreductase C-terminal domain-containing protein, partial [Halolamina sp.]